MRAADPAYDRGRSVLAGAPTPAAGRAGTARVEACEAQSELTLVPLEVRADALGQLPERKPDAFLDFPRVVPEPRLAYQVPAYVLRRVLQTAQASLTLAGALVAIALAAEFFHSLGSCRPRALLPSADSWGQTRRQAGQGRSDPPSGGLVTPRT